MDIFELKKPDITGKMDKAIGLLDPKENIAEYIENISTPEYLYWDKVRHKPRPKGISPEEFWALIKFLRQMSPNRVSTAVADEKGSHFSWQQTPGLDYFLHEIDMQLGGFIESSIVDDQTARQRYISRGIMEEAIASSQLEGANTTRKAAKQMLLEKKKPRNKSEQMILNNYNGMVAVEESFQYQPLSMERLFDLHVILAKDTMNISEIGRLRKDNDEVVVVDRTTDVIYHIPPSEAFLRDELKKLISYANDELAKDKFVHPVIKAIILHFWVAYLHPFTDGNGRLARLIFYWYLLKKQYWAFSYLNLSRVIKKSPAQYRDAYIYTEQDDNDLTYFIDYVIRKIQQAKREFERYVERKTDENRGMAETARLKYKLNDRQIQLMRHLHKNPGSVTTIKVHSHIYKITRLTARKDLEALQEMRFLVSHKSGRERPFTATAKSLELFK
ncbi:MAG: Fic family protein [candidate division Zixibacteria bacterium]|nr:Fic family protein [candidate division Zixibacteria bacterium]MBU1469528.1 Fic family protein [candidate division Zixibacteria bacterium]MBU2624570.1 Fic family protein [candidate division Zixibacteria bacterium]